MSLKDKVVDIYKSKKEVIIKGALFCALFVAIAKIIYDAVKKD